MVQNRSDEMEAGAQQPDMYGLLCKVVFGEASAEESAQVEAALLGSAELQAQKAELEATVALVRGSMGALGSAEAKLSAGRMEAVLGAAAAPAVQRAPDAPAGELITNTPWHRSPVLRAAAVALLVGGGIWFTQGRQPGDDVDLAGGAELGPSVATGGFHGLDDRTLEDVTNGLEDMASFGLEAAGPGTPGTNAAGSPASGFRLATSGDTQGFPEDPSVAINPATPGMGGEPGRSSVLSPSGFDVFTVGSAGPAGTIAMPGSNRRAAWSKGVARGRPVAPEAKAAGPGGAYRGPGDSIGPANGELTSIVRPAAKPPGASSRPQVVISGSDVPIDLPIELTRASKPSGPIPALRGFSSGGAAELDQIGYLHGTSGVDVVHAGRGGSLPGVAVLELDGYGAGLNGEFAGQLLLAPEDRRGAGGGGGWFERRTRPGADPPHRRRHLVHEPKALPGERPRDMFFRFWGDNPFVISERDAQSTFAADVDTASFALARRTLESGRLPQRAQVRTEEFVNFLEPDLACPTEDTFGVHAELSPSPFGGAANRYLLRVGVRAKDVAPAERPPLALTFVVDTSGSMRENNRLELVKHALRLLVDQLDGRDTISIVRFSTDASVVLEPTPATSGDVIETALFGLQPDGSTNAEAGLKLGYAMAERTLAAGATAKGTQTRVVFLSDGVANVGQTDQDRIAADVKTFSDRNVFLNTIGVGMGNHNDVFLEQLADRGQGVCDYVGDAKDARRAIVERFVGGFVTVAKDVKIQVEFDPRVVLRWRQIGYENRAVRDQDFRNDKVDAGEIGAGHQVTCLYEIELASGDAKDEHSIATARLRWKPVTPGEVLPADEATERELAFVYGDIAASSFRGATHGFRRSALAAQLAESLRDSIHTAGDPVETLGKELAQLLSEDRHKDTATIAEMTRQAISLGLKTRPSPTLTDVDADHLDSYYDALIRSLGGVDPQEGSKKGVDADKETARVEPRERESRIRDLLEGNQDGKAQ